MELFEHQKKIIDENKLWAGLWLGTGSAKTRIALELAERRTLVVCPKQQKLDKTWERNMEKFSIILDLTVMSKEEFRRDWEKLEYFDTFIVDEGHHFFGATPDTRQVNKVTTPKTSQLFDSLRGYLKRHNPKRFYILSATPASKPMNVWAIATLFGCDWDFYKFRNKFYLERKIGWRSIWIPRNSIELKAKLVELIKRFGYTGKLSDWFDVPEQTHRNIYVGLKKEQSDEIKNVKKLEADPMSKRSKLRTIENGCMYDTKVVQVNHKMDRMERKTYLYANEKIDHILELALEFPKMLVFANYTGQIEGIALALRAEGYSVLTLTGETKDRKSVMEEAESMSHIIVIAQAQICEGYEFKSCPVVIFASKSTRYLHYNQACGRVLRADGIKKNLYIHLIVRDGIDEICHKTIISGEDFQEKINEN